MITKRTALIIGISLIGFSPLIQAQSKEPYKVVVGFAPGGALDTYARNLAGKLEKLLDAQVLVENKPGAGARMALEHVKRAKADGKTILISPAPPFTIYPLTYKKLNYDPDKDLTPVAFLADVPLVASAGVNQPYNTMGEYFKWAKENPQKPGFGLVSFGGATHFGILTMNEKVGIRAEPAAYKGAAPMLTDEIGGALPIGIDAVASKMELYKAGKIKFLGVTGEQRSKFLPDVPTLKEAGAPGFETANGWYSAFVPAGTDAATIKKLEAAFISAANDKEVVERMASLGMDSNAKPGQFIAELIQTQRNAWRPAVEKSGYVAE